MKFVAIDPKPCDLSMRMLAQKQPHIKRVRNSSLVEWFCAENVTGLSIQPKLRIVSNDSGRGAFHTG